MTNIATVLCVVLFASASNALFWKHPLKDAQAGVQTVTDGVISKIDEEFVAAQLKAVTAGAELGERTLKFTAKIDEEVAKVSDSIANTLGDAVSTGDISGDEVEECAPTSDSDKLEKLSKALTTKTSKCVNDKVDTGLGYLEGLQKVYDDVLLQLEGVKEEASHCGEKLALFGAMCAKRTAAKAAWISARAAPQLASGWARFKLLSGTLEASLDVCIRRDRFAFNREASLVRARIQKCIKQKIADAKATTTAAPTTAKPTTAKPTTAKPTTAKPTTAKPTTAKPTTAKPTTAKPTTAKPTTAKPTTAKPTTATPTTAKPTSTEAPVTEAAADPVTEAAADPVTEAAAAPAADAGATPAPAADAGATPAPAADAGATPASAADGGASP